MHQSFMQLGAHFPKPEGPEVIIDVSLFEERQLTAVSGDTYPLIIRLECVSDKGKTESHQLKVCCLILYTYVRSVACMSAMLCTSLHILAWRLQSGTCSHARKVMTQHSCTCC